MLGVNVHVQPSCLLINDFLSGEMLRVLESSAGMLNITGDSTNRLSCVTFDFAGTAILLAVQD